MGWVRTYLSHSMHMSAVKANSEHFMVNVNSPNENNPEQDGAKDMREWSPGPAEGTYNSHALIHVNFEALKHEYPDQDEPEEDSWRRGNTRREGGSRRVNNPTRNLIYDMLDQMT